MKLNILLYLLFILVLSIAMLSEYFLGDNLSKRVSPLGWSILIFPILSIVLNFCLIERKGVLHKVFLSLLSGGVFYVFGALTLLFLVKVRIMLGLSI